MKKCSKCNIEKELSEFYVQKASKVGYRSECRECTKLYKIESKDKRDIYYLENKKSILEKNKQWVKDNVEKTKSIKEKWRIKNKSYRRNNSSKINDNVKKRRESDPIYRISCSLRSSIYNIFRYKGYSKKSKTSEILGCSYNELIEFIELKFEPWMTWENYGKYNGELNFGWDIDHIKPLSLAKNEEELIGLNHYTNLQPLCSKINRCIKRDNENFAMIK